MEDDEYDGYDPGQGTAVHAPTENTKLYRWTEEEHDKLINIVRTWEELESADGIQEKRLGNKWEYVSAQLEEQGHFRSSPACRGYWQRTVGEKWESKGQHDANQTTMGQSFASHKRKRSRITVESDDESAPSEPAKQKTLRAIKSDVTDNNDDSLDQSHLVTHQQYGSMAPGQIDKFDNKIRELESTKAVLTKEIADLDTSLTTLRRVKEAKQQELDGVERKIVANQDGKKALQSLRVALGNPDIE